MLGKQLTTVLAITVLALAGGLGYAAFTSTITVNGSAQAGTLTLGFNVPVTTGTTNPTAAGTCYFSGTGGSTTLTVTNMAPGDTCTATITVQNSGTLPTSSETTTASGSYLCAGAIVTDCYVITDNLGLNSYFGTPGSGGALAANTGSFVYSATVTLPAGSTTQSSASSFTISITGTVGS
jgi:hypothetical protein